MINERELRLNLEAVQTTCEGEVAGLEVVLVFETIQSTIMSVFHRVVGRVQVPCLSAVFSDLHCLNGTQLHCLRQDMSDMG